MDIASQFVAACARREALFARIEQGFEVFRVFDGAADGVASLFIDRLGPVLLAHLLEEGDVDAIEHALTQNADNLLRRSRCSTFYLRVHRKAARRTASEGARLLAGVPISSCVAREGRLGFLVKPSENVNGGLFVDMREVRAALAAGGCIGERVLNTFAFTGSLGISAYAGGAREVVQVDISKGILNWARENFALNKTDSDSDAVMRFIVEDSSAFMDRELRRIQRGAAELYDRVIIDPPVFGAGRGRPFSFLRDAEGLVQRGLCLLRPGGVMLCATNLRAIEVGDLEKMVREASHACRVPLAKLSRIAPPQIDFPSSGAGAISMKAVELMRE